jgi:5-methylcytosine-specific restriction endonuclease McrA
VHDEETLNGCAVDHIIPKRDGGTDDRANLRVLCETHNKGRSRASIEPRPRFSRNTLTETTTDDDSNDWSFA